MVEIIETPRDAMQGISRFIPTEKKVHLIQKLLGVGFDIIDFGSFVSSKAIPQLKDTSEVVDRLDLSNTNTKLLAIIGNLRGAEKAVSYEKITIVGYPHSISDQFLKLNINSSIEKSRRLTADLMNFSQKSGQLLLVYLSMAFGNPYGHEWSYDQLMEECEFLNKLGVKRIALSDTTGSAVPEQLGKSFAMLSKEFPDIHFGLHLHTAKRCWLHLVDDAYKNGCRSFDGGIGGLGGCPLSGYELVENLKTKYLLWYLDKNNIPHSINKHKFDEAEILANSIFNYHEPDIIKV